MSSDDEREQQVETKSAEDEYNEVSTEFEKVAKRILIFKTDKRRTVPTDEAKVLKYKTDIVEAYNNFVEFIARVYDSQSTKTKEALQRDFDNVHKPKLLECLKVFQLTTQLPENFLSLDIDSIIDIATPEVENNSQKSLDTASTSSVIQDTEKTSSAADQVNKANDNDKTPDLADNTLNTSSYKTVEAGQLSPNRTINNNNNTMPQTTQEFLKMASGVLNYKYDADPLKLESFLADVEIVEAMAEAEQTAFCLKFIKAKLDQKALEHLPEVIREVKDITDALRTAIKVESSDVIEGKILALRLHRGN